MNRFSSIFGQILQLFSKREFFEAVYATQAERGAKGFSWSYNQILCMAIKKTYPLLVTKQTMPL